MKSAGKARNNGLYRHIRTSKEIIRNLLNDFYKNNKYQVYDLCSCQKQSEANVSSAQGYWNIYSSGGILFFCFIKS